MKTREELLKLFPNASEAFLARNSGPTRETVERLHQEYQQDKNIHVAAKKFGIGGQTAKNWLNQSGYRLFNSDWTDDEVAKLREMYSDSSEAFSIERFAAVLNRTFASVALKAAELGLTRRRTDQRRPSSIESRQRRRTYQLKRFSNQEERDKISSRFKQWHKDNAHPRGFLGGKHTPEARRKISEKLLARHMSLTPKQRREIAKARRIKMLANGNSWCPRIRRGSWKAQWAEIGGKRFFARSSWEVRYANYLELLKRGGAITEWDHETKTFWFPVKRGTTNYTPDFQVTFNDGRIEYHEVKGWMDSRSRTTIRRMRIYHKTETLIVIGADWFKANKNIV